MSQTKYCIVNLLTDGIEQRHVIIHILSYTMRLYCFYIRVSKQIINVAQIITGNNIVCIKNQCNVKIITYGSHTNIQRLRFGAFLEMHLYQTDRKSGQRSICFRLHTV